MAGSSQKNRRNVGNKVSDADRKTSKKDVALAKAEQKREHAAKQWARKRDKQFKSDLAEFENALAAIKDEIRARGKEVALGGTFLRQIEGFVKKLNSYDRVIKLDKKQSQQLTAGTLQYTKVDTQFRKVSPLTEASPLGAALMSCALLIIVVRELLVLGKKR